MILPIIYPSVFFSRIVSTTYSKLETTNILTLKFSLNARNLEWFFEFVHLSIYLSFFFRNPRNPSIIQNSDGENARKQWKNLSTRTRCCPRRDPFNMQTINRSTHPLTNRFHFLFDERTRAASILRIFIAQRLLTSDPTKITIQTTFQQFSTALSILSPLENFQLGRSNVFPRFPGKRIP